MKRILALLLILVMILTLVSCTNPHDDSTDTTDNATENELAEGERFVYEHVIIVGIDGMGTYHTKTDTPNIDKLFGDAALTDIARTSAPQATGPCWLSSFTGAHPISQMRTPTNPDQTTPTVNKRFEEALKTFPTIFSMTHDKYPEAKIASFVTWMQLNDYCINDEEYVYKKNLSGDDLKLKIEAVDYIIKEKPTLLFLHFDSVDGKGHTVGYGTEEYLDQLTVVDSYLGEVYAALEKAGILDSTLIILATDHGGEGTKHGGTETDAVMNITLGFKGKTIKPLKDFEMNLRDVATVVAYALGLEDSPKWTDAKIPEGLFSDMGAN